MKTRLLIIGIVLSLGLTGTAFATHDPTSNHPTPMPELNPLAITLDKETYNTGETIKISGNVSIKESESLATITLHKPDETVVTSIQILPNSEGIVSYHFKAGSGNMDVSGKYAIEFQYGSKVILKQFSFNVIEDKIQIKTIGSDAPFFGIFIHIDNLFSWIMGK